ncbi:insulin-degrading enzyme-like [Varroa jacobsoni]|uniref:insulin-degrading enzyme-like n=1 Tax=Varroa jacobsoni TaxID=62625 RepID=UPI000BF31278|nr:insulin-degrading enzyme-like [Varroa jacobsoni]
MLCVQAGSLFNPPELPGLAHYTEHMLFMGSKKYPGENDWDTFISKHGSLPNAQTDATATCYFYEIDPNYLDKSLDILLSAFTAPLCKKSLIELEINAVDNEFRDKMNDDETRQQRVDEVTADLAHPYSLFKIGNIESLQKAAKRLNIDLRTAVMNFIKKYYSSNLMSALVFSSHSLAQLEKLAAKAFSSLVNRHTPLPNWTSPYLGEHLGVFIKIVPVDDETRLKLIFPLPNFDKYYESRPEQYLVSLLGHEGAGSIYSNLQKKGHVIQLEASTNDDMPGNNYIDISLKLPNEGVDYVDDIIGSIFQYVAMLKQSGPKKWLFDEIATISTNSFLYPRKDFTEEEQITLCKDLNNFPWRHALSGRYVFDTFDADLISHFTDLIDPSRMRVFIQSKSFENITDKQEHYYNVRYKVERIGDDKIQRWKKATPSPYFTLPERNDLIPDNFSIALSEDRYNCLPDLVVNTSSFHMWFMQDRSLNMPYATFLVIIRHPKLVSSVENVVALEMMIRLFMYSITESFYNARLAGFSINIGRSNEGFCIYVDGYNQHMHSLIKKIMKSLSTYRIANWQTDFFKLKKEYEEYLLMTINERQTGRTSIQDLINPYLQRNYFSLSQLLSSLGNCSVERTQEILDTLRNDSTVEAFIHGNSVSAEAKSVAGTIVSTFKRGVLSFLDTPSLRQAKLRRGVAYRQYKVNAQLSSNHLYMFFEVDRAGNAEDRLVALCALFAKLIKEPLFNVIRTKEQLAYMVQAVDKAQQGSFGVAFYLVTSYKLSHVEDRLAKFVREYFKDFLTKLTYEAFAEQKRTATKQKLKKPQKMEDVTALFWQEMVDQSYILQRTSKEGAAMRSLTKEDIIQFYEKFLVRLESTTVYALYLSNSMDQSRVEWSAANYNVTSVDSFRADHEYHSFEKDRSIARMSPPSI